MLGTLLKTADASLLSLLDEQEMDMSKVKDGIMTCTNWWDKYCTDVSTADTEPHQSLDLQANSFTVDLFKGLLRQAVQAADVPSRISIYKALIFLSPAIVGSTKRLRDESDGESDSSTSKRHKAGDEEDDEDDEDDADDEEEEPGGEPVPPAGSVSTSVEYVVAPDAAEIRVNNNANMEEARQQLSSQIGSSDATTQETAREPAFYNSMLQQVVAANHTEKENWIRTAVTLTGYARDRVLSDAESMQPADVPREITHMTRRDVYVPWTRFSKAMVEVGKKLKLEGWMLKLINCFCSDLYDDCIGRVFSTRFWHNGAYHTKICLYGPTIIMDLAFAYCNRLFSGVLSAMQGYCNVNCARGVRSSLNGTENSPVNKFLSGIAVEVERMILNSSSHKRRMQDCLTQAQRETVKASVKKWEDGFKKGLKSSGVSTSRVSKEFQAGEAAGRQIGRSMNC